MIPDLYPFSTKDAQPIPLDIIRPVSVARVAFVDGVSTAALDLADSEPVVILKTTAPCLIGFGVDPAVLADNTLTAGIMALGMDEVVVVAPISPILKVMGDGGAGSLTITKIAKWSGIGLEAQFQQT